MSTNTKIAWTDATWNPIVGCTKVSAGCQKCYAERMAKRLKAMGKCAYQNVVDDDGNWTGRVELGESKLTEPLRWRKPRMVLVCLMGDLFHHDVPFDCVDQMVAVMARCPQHQFQVLTKRPKRMAEYCDYAIRFDNLEEEIERQWDCQGAWPRPTEGDWPFPNIWLGTSVESAVWTNRITSLRRVKAHVRFLSLEPLLGPIPHLSLSGIHWVIVGCESGPGARGHDEYEANARSIIEQCRDAGVAVLHKQMPVRQGKRWRVSREPAAWPEELRIRQWPGKDGE